MFSEYFEGWDVKSGYSKEFISLWGGWLGEKGQYKLDEVTELEWEKFNALLRGLAKDFSIYAVNCGNRSLTKVFNIESILSTYQESLSKDSSTFLKLVFPELGCVITEEWDYTYIVWYKNRAIVKRLVPYIRASGLQHFHS